MWYMIEGKITNQPPRGGSYYTAEKHDVNCARCNKEITLGKHQLVSANGYTLYCMTTIGTPYFIYETKSGFSVTYCSEYCDKKHNHRHN